MARLRLQIGSGTTAAAPFTGHGLLEPDEVARLLVSAPPVARATSAKLPGLRPAPGVRGKEEER